jgi:hypothetical protein
MSVPKDGNAGKEGVLRPLLGVSACKLSDASSDAERLGDEADDEADELERGRLRDDSGNNEAAGSIRGLTTLTSSKSRFTLSRSFLRLEKWRRTTNVT